MSNQHNLHERLKIKQYGQEDKISQAQLLSIINRDVLFFFKYFLWTYNPRKTPSDLPFIPWDYQEKFITELNQDIIEGRSQLTEKSRDMGVTWMILGVFVYRWLVHNENFLVGSRKEELVDKIGDMSTHFERMRYLLTKLPDWMITYYGWERKNSGYMKLFKENGASITGESMNSSFSRQGRYKAILLDEFAFVDRAEIVWRACGDSAPCKLPISTPNGSNNMFCHLRKSGQIKVNTIHWRLHPEKTPEWYEQQKKDRSDKDTAQELDINYTISAGDPFYRGFSRALHLRKMNISKEKDLLLGWDYGFRHPNCSIHQITTEGLWIIVDNIFGENCTIDQFANQVKLYLNHKWEGYTFAQGYGDPAGKQSSDHSTKSSEQILNEAGFKVLSVPSNTSTTNYTARKNIIEKKLATLINGVPSLVVNDTPGNSIIAEGFEGGYRYPDSNKYGGVADKPVEDGFFEHPFNSLEYVAINRFKIVEQNKEEEKKREKLVKSYSKPINAGFKF